MQNQAQSQQRLTSRIDVVAALLRLYRRSNNPIWAMQQLDRIAAEVLFHEFTRPTEHLGSVSRLYELVADMDQTSVGRLTSSYDSTRRGGQRVDSKTHAIAKRADIDERICRLLERNHIRSWLIKIGESELLENLRVGCKACRHSRVSEIDAMLREGQTVREVSYFTARCNEPVSKSTIHTHRRHISLVTHIVPSEHHQTKGGVRS